MPPRPQGRATRMRGALFVAATAPPDLVNQWQILACVEHGVTAPLAAPFKPRDADLFAIVSAFEAAYSAYADFQSNMERYWCLRWLTQENAKQVDAVVLKDEVLRLTELPLIIKLPGMPQVLRGAESNSIAGGT